MSYSSPSCARRPVPIGHVLRVPLKLFSDSSVGSSIYVTAPILFLCLEVTRFHFTCIYAYYSPSEKSEGYRAGSNSCLDIEMAHSIEI